MIKYNKLVVAISLVAMLSVGCGSAQAEKQIIQGYDYLEKLDYEDALLEFGLVTTKTKEQAKQLSRGIGIAHMGLMQYEESIRAFETALSYSNGIVQNIDYDINYYMASAYYKNGNYEQAIETYEAIIAIDPMQIQAHYMKGIAKLHSGQIEEACAEFEAAIACNPKDYDVLIAIVQNLNEVGESARGKVYLQAVIDTELDNLDHVTRGTIYYYLEEYDNARLSLDEAKGTSERATLILGKTYEKLGDVNYAGTVYRDYLRTNPHSVLIYNQLAICLMEQGLYQDALDATQDGLLIEESALRQTLLYNEIVLYEHLNDFDMAKILMESYLEKYPSDEKALREYDFLQTR